MRRALTLLLAVLVGVVFAEAAFPEAAQAQTPACHRTGMEMPGQMRPPGTAPHGLHACCLCCAGVELRAALEDRAGAVGGEALRFSVLVAALAGRMTPPALGPPKRLV